MHILVTGGSGRIGGYVLRELLQRGHAVTSFSRTTPLVEGARVIRGELVDRDSVREACRGQEAIIHLGAISGAAQTTLDQYMNVNVMGTLSVLEAAIAAGVRRVVSASSGAALGFSFQRRPMIPNYFPMDEAHPAAPQDEYGLSKVLGEIICKRYSDAFGLPVICLRLNNNWHLDRPGTELAIRSGLFKGRFDSVEALWTEYRLRTEDPERGTPSGRNFFWEVTDVRDAAHACCLAVENNEVQYDVAQTCGDTTYSNLDTPTLLARYYPNVPLRKPLRGHDALYSHEHATRVLGYRPQHALRESDFWAWAQRQ